MTKQILAIKAQIKKTVMEIHKAVFDFHRATVYSLLNEHIKFGYLERVSDSHYRATLYAKDIMNVKGWVVV